MTLPRRLDLRRDLTARSVFLFGPRQTGKTTYLNQLFPRSPRFNLLHGEVFLRLSREPGRLRAELATVDPASGPVIIDEIQKLPGLLDEVHDLIESRGLRFVLAASSPAKLRRGGVNLLGGRARTHGLFPFVSAEVPDWDLMRAVNVGGIPSIYYSDDPIEALRAYCGTYLQMEIQAEGLVRGVERFSRFLAAAALTCGEQVVFDRVAADAAVPPRTVREYFQVLEDTLLGSLLQPYRPRRPRRKPASHAKLYLFDVGVANVLAGTTRVEAASPAFGRALEQLVFCELRACLAYNRSPDALTFWRTTDGSEVDFVIGDDVAIEVKGTGAVTRRDLTGLRRIAAETPLRRRIVVCTESAARIVDGIEIVPVREFLHALWNSDLIESHAPTPARPCPTGERRPPSTCCAQ